MLIKRKARKISTTSIGGTVVADRGELQALCRENASNYSDVAVEAQKKSRMIR